MFARTVFFVLLGLSVVLFSCSKDRPAPVAPAGKSLASLAAPAVPTNLRFDALTDSSCTVRWDASDGATDYDVNYKPAVGGRWTNEPHRGIGLSNTIDDLQPNTEYRWAVRAENSDGASEWIHGPNFTTRSSEDDSLNSAPAAPTNLRFDALTDSSCTVRWDASDGATDYDVNYKPAVGGRWTNEPHRGIGLSNTIDDLQPNTEYRWAVRAENSDGASEWIHGPNFTTAQATSAQGDRQPNDTISVAVDDTFNIELVFLDEFSQKQQEWIQDVAGGWDMYFDALPDYTFENAETFQSQSKTIRIQAGDVIDDFRIYVALITPEIERLNQQSDWDGDFYLYGFTTVEEYRTGGDVPLVAVIWINQEDIEDYISKSATVYSWRERQDARQNHWYKIFHHELGHAFGIGPSPAWERNIAWHGRNDVFFTGENAHREARLIDFYDPRGVPVLKKGFSSSVTPIHWGLFAWDGTQSPPWTRLIPWTLFHVYFLQDNGAPYVDRVSLGAFEDIGWPVNYEMAGEFLLGQPISLCWERGEPNNFHLYPSCGFQFSP